MKYLVLAALVLSAGGFDDPPDKKGEQVPDGLKALKHPDAAVRYRAAAVLVRLGPIAKFAVPELRESLKDTNGFVRVKAAEALWTIDKTAPALLVPVLVQTLRESDPELRAAAPPVLGKMGAKAFKAVPFLIDALKDKDENVRIEVVVALGEIGPLAKDAAPALLDLVRADDKSIIEPFVAAALGSMGAGAVAVLGEALADKQIKRRRVAAEALGMMGLHARPARKALADALRDSDAQVRGHAAKALGSIGLDAREAVVPLRNALQDRDVSVRIQAAVTLWLIEERALHLPVLLEALGDSSALARADACRALGMIGPAAKDAVPALTKLLGERNSPLRQQAAEALGQIGPAAAGADQPLRKLLKDEEPMVRSAAAFSLWRISGNAGDCLDVLGKGLKDEDRAVRRQAAVLVERIGTGARALVPVLIEGLQDEDESVRAAVKDALMKVDAEAARKAGVR